jgi:hypothetical protein
MRVIFAAIIMLSASTAVGHAAEAQKHARLQPGYGPNQFQFDKKRVEEDNELLDLPATQGKVTGADQVESEENALAKLIEQENARIDRELKGICRGC